MWDRVKNFFRGFFIRLFLIVFGLLLFFCFFLFLVLIFVLKILWKVLYLFFKLLYYLLLRNNERKKNDYSISFYYHNERILFLEYVHDTEKAFAWCRQKNIKWDICVIYERRSRALLGFEKNPSELPFFSCSFFYGSENVLFLDDVYNYTFAIEWAKKRGFVFDCVKVYNKMTRGLIEKIYV